MIATVLVLLPVLGAPIQLAPADRMSFEPLWPAGAPGAMGNEDGDRPALAAYLPTADRRPGPVGSAMPAVVICPGGAYTVHAMDHEGLQIARWLNQQGIAAFVLRYRLGDKYHFPVQLQDVMRAIRTVRSGAKKAGVAPDKIGVWGFSAGGHLASMAATLFDEGNPNAKDAIDRASGRPDFAILSYAVLQMDGEFTHLGSRKKLIGETPTAEQMQQVSTPRRVTPRTPPTFLFHTSSDTGVPPENSVLFYLALRKAGVPAEMHIYERGNHGVGLAQGDPVLSSWGARLSDWFHVRGILPGRDKSP